MVCLFEPTLLYGVGQWYRDFAQVSDDEVIAALVAGADGPERWRAGKPQPIGGFLRWSAYPRRP